MESGGIAPDHNQPVSGIQKDDIYAFGVLLLELLTGKKPFDGYAPPHIRIHTSIYVVVK